MKVYNVKKGTRGWLLTRLEGTNNYTERSWVVRKDLSSLQPILDPVMLSNSKEPERYHPRVRELVKMGYGVYVSELAASHYFLAVNYAHDVEVLC